MVLIEKFGYITGQVLAEVVLIALAPSSTYTAYKVFTKFSSIASTHSLKNKTADIVSENLYKCLYYID
jgi:hypothetical protein